MLNRKLYLLMMIMALLGLFLAACGSSEEEPEEGAETVTETEEEAEAEPTEEPMAEEEEVMEEEEMAEPDYDTSIYGVIDDIDLEGVTVVFWHQHSGAREEELIKIVDEFNASNEWGIVVEARNEGGYDDIYNKMIAGLSSGELPALVVAYQNQAAAYMVADGLVSLDPYINHPVYGLTEEDRADFFQSFLDSDRLPQFGMETYGFPPNRSMEVLFYNAAWLEELGYDAPPQNLAEFVEMSCAASETPFSQNPDPSFSLGYEVRTDASSVAALTFAGGSDIYDFDNNTFTYNNDVTANALSTMAQLLADGCAGEITESFGDQTDFGNGKVLFTMGSSSGLPFYASAVNDGEAGGFSWSVAPIPYEGATPVQNIYGASVSVPVTTPEEQLAAWLFLRFYTNADIQARWARASNYFPVRESVADGLGDYFTENPAYAVAFDLLQYGKIEAPVAGYDLVRDEAEGAFVRILAGEDPATVLAELDASANQILEEAAP
ncbi:MAG: extracellular solute-binding protein [Anaerolineales bacterium]|nr:extracellular solute-binding protein [Anaerolineales bacterium]